MAVRTEASYEAPPPTHAPTLEDREFAVLRELGGEGHASVGFQGLRRKLEIHQQILSRTLRRLEAQGLVERDGKGYKLTEEGHQVLAGRAPSMPVHETLAIAQAMLPPHLTAESVVEHLAQRWFRGLRWYSQAEAPDETVLTWLTEPGGRKVRVRVTGGAVLLECDASPQDAGAYLATRGVLGAIAELYGLAPISTGDGNAYGVFADFAA